MMDLAEWTKSRYEVIGKLFDIREAPDRLITRIQWKELPDQRDWTEEAVTELYVDMPKVVSTFLKSEKANNKLGCKAKPQLYIF